MRDQHLCFISVQSASLVRVLWTAKPERVPAVLARADPLFPPCFVVVASTEMGHTHTHCRVFNELVRSQRLCSSFSTHPKRFTSWVRVLQSAEYILAVNGIFFVFSPTLTFFFYPDSMAKAEEVNTPPPPPPPECQPVSGYGFVWKVGFGRGGSESEGKSLDF